MYSANVTDKQATCANQVGIKLYNNVGRFFALKTFGGINEKNEVDPVAASLKVITAYSPVV